MALCLFDGSGAETRIPLLDFDAGVWHGFIPGVSPGQLYGYRAEGTYDPSRGLRFNPAKLLLDPYARAISGEVRNGPEVLGYRDGNPDLQSSDDSSACVPRSVVVGPDRRRSRSVEAPDISYADSIVYETHVKGITVNHPDVPPKLRGTYAGLGHEAVLEHFVKLGVTTIELLPVHEHIPEPFLVERGLTNYWGYNTIGFFSPHASYSAAVRAGKVGGQVSEFKSMADAIHAAGLQLILDVVYNHTAEGNEFGPTLCFRGLDNPGYYRLDTGDPRHYYDTTGCGNALNGADPFTLRLILDSLRYWASEMHVDGFRFDLAPTLARSNNEFDRVSAFFDLVAQDPVVSRVKLIAEPWDVGQSDSYDIGRFPPLWSEWNGRYRDTVRDFWRSKAPIGEFADRLTGSASLYEADRRRPTASVNFVAVHDGFTLRDLVSYNEKHNEANGDDNRDGTDDNRSWNCGAEGDTTDATIETLRGCQARALVATVLLSFGVPLLQGGDELGRTQLGNNNAYCQDNTVTWYDWAQVDARMLTLVRRLTSLRAAHPVFRRRRFLFGAESGEVRWFSPSGEAMTEANWQDPETRCLTVYLDGRDDPDRDYTGALLVDDDFLLFVNGWWEPLSFAVPLLRPAQRWTVVLDTAGPDLVIDADALEAGASALVSPRSLSLWRSPVAANEPAGA
jgi:glycogen operon protein